MSRSRVISLVIVLVLANYLVFTNLGFFLWRAGEEAVTRVSSTRQPRITRTAATATPVASVPADTPTPLPTLTPTSTPLGATATPAATPTLVRTPTPNRSAIPLYTPGAPLKYPFRYVIRQGDVLSVLANRFNVPMAKILAANGLSNPDLIRIGQELIIPDPTK